MMINLKSIPLLILLCSGTFSARAQVSFGSLEEVFRYADQNAIGIQNAKDQQMVAASKSKAAKAALLPAINALAGFNDNITLQPTLVPANLLNPNAPTGTFNEFTFGRQYLYSAGVQFSWDVINFQKWFEVATSQAAQKLSEASTRNTRFQVCNQLAQTYYSILLTEKYIGIAKDNILAADSIYSIAREKYEAGIFSEENLNRSKIQQVQALQQAGNLQASLAQLYNQLQSQLNTPEQVTITGELSEAPPAIDETNTPRLHPLVDVQQAQLQLSGQQLQQSRTLQYPTLAVGYQYNHNWASDKMFDLSSANNLPQQFWGIKLNIPVFNGFSAREKVYQSRVLLHQQHQVLENQIRLIQIEDENLQIQYQQSMEDLKRQEAILRLQSNSDGHVKDRYENGIIGLDERLDKFQDLLLVQNQYMQSLSNYYISYYKRYLRIKF